MLQWMKDQSKQRRLLLSELLGIESSNELSRVLGTEDERSQLHHDSSNSSLTQNTITIDHDQSQAGYLREDLHLHRLKKRIKRNSTNNDKEPLIKASEPREVAEEDQGERYEYKGSSAFLKGTQSANPHNDYCQHYVDTGQRPQNFIRDYELHDRFEEYPKLKELIRLKDELIACTATPPMYLKCNLQEPSQLTRHLVDNKFDVILIDPPLEEYQRTQGVTKTKFWSWQELMHLEVGEIAAPRSFIFLWCGSSDGLDLGRQCLRKWGFRRCEDICWIKTNRKNIGHTKNSEPKAIFQRTKEHCLMGIKGTVRRSTHGDFIHSNVDIDLIISEEPPYGSYEKPVEIFQIVEHFCLGRRRLHMFGKDSTIRPGWLTIGPELTNSNFNLDLYKEYFTRGSTEHLTRYMERIEALRPKSPPPKGTTNGNWNSRLRFKNNL